MSNGSIIDSLRSWCNRIGRRGRLHLRLATSLGANFLKTWAERVFGLALYIEMAWIFSTALGMLLFLVVVVLACWVKFWNISKWSAGVCFLIVGPVVVVFMLFAVFFYRTLISFKYAHASRLVDSLDRWMLELERGSCPPPPPPLFATASSPRLTSSLPATPTAATTQQSFRQVLPNTASPSLSA